MQQSQQDEVTKEDLENVYEINNKYTILLDYKLGSGAFGQIYKCLNKENNKLYAAKIEPYDTNNPQLQKENKFLNELKGNFGFPINYDYINKSTDKILIIDLLGPNLGDIMYNLPNKKFSIKTTLMITNQILQRIKDLHNKNIIHRDIKPENFVIGRAPKERIIYMIDFGLSKHYINEKTNTHIPYKNERNVLGTLRYISINCHMRIEVSRRDDLESFFYIIVYFFTGTLPWIGIRCKNKEEKFKKVFEKKKECVPDKICNDLPEEFKMFINYVLNLEFMETPNYNYLNDLINKLFTRFGYFKDDINFDWYNKEFLQKLYDKCSRNENNSSENNKNINNNNENINNNNNKENKNNENDKNNENKNNDNNNNNNKNITNIKNERNNKKFVTFKSPPVKNKIGKSLPFMNLSRKTDEENKKIYNQKHLSSNTKYQINNDKNILTKSAKISPVNNFKIPKRNISTNLNTQNTYPYQIKKQLNK